MMRKDEEGRDSLQARLSSSSLIISHHFRCRGSSFLIIAGAHPPRPKTLTTRAQQTPPLPVPGGSLAQGTHVQTARAAHAAARRPRPNPGPASFWNKKRTLSRPNFEAVSWRAARDSTRRRGDAEKLGHTKHMMDTEVSLRRTRDAPSSSPCSPVFRFPYSMASAPPRASCLLAARLSGQPFIHCGVAVRNSDGPASSAAVSRS